ncbi:MULTISPECIES: hypothetical protein [Halorussus]|uniref:Uncharacterized protein n=1 Tax=Halorussus aquaticus TaxID=2953748 RepID=A0ABD5PYU7_9EURY|nr:MULTISPECIES: hypothetical protein [Halorussus]NEU58317.1 hypothetical protein [Halorussus sp. MSC15.2]
MAATDNVTFWEMFRDLPVRTTVATVVPLFLGLAQLLNGYVHGVPMVRVAGFAAGMVIAAVLVTQYQLVEYNRKELQREVFGDE